MPPESLHLVVGVGTARPLPNLAGTAIDKDSG